MKIVDEIKKPYVWGSLIGCLVITCLCCLILVFLGAIVTVAILPPSFSYVSKSQMAYKKQVSENYVETDKIYFNGRYLWGPDYTPVTFKRVLIDVEYIGGQFKGDDWVGGPDNALLVFSKDQLEFAVEIQFRYQLPQTVPELRNIWNTFNKAYKLQVKNLAVSTIKNQAPQFTLDEFIENRTYVRNVFFQVLRDELANINITLDNGKFQMRRQILPETIQNKFLSNAVLEQETLAKQFEQDAKDIRAETQVLKQEILANATVIKQEALGEADNIVRTAKAEARKIVEIKRGEGFLETVQSLGINGTNEEEKLFQIFSILDNSEAKLLVGDNFNSLINV